MADPAPPISTPVVQVLPFEVRIVRWWQSNVNIVMIWSVFSEGWLPILLLVDPTMLGFSVQIGAAIQLALKLINASVAVTVRNRTINVVGSKDDVAKADAAPDPVPANA